MKDFYVEVLSNGSFEFNTVAEFKNKIQLLHPLQGNWEVGISEISYTKSWYNIPHPTSIGMTDGKNNIEAPNIDDHVAYLDRCGTLKQGYYEDVQTLVDEINKEIQSYGPDYNERHIVTYPVLFYDKVATKQITIIPGKDNNGKTLVPVFEYDLRKLLGFDEMYTKDIRNSQGYFLSNRPVDISMGIHHLLVYCNLILPQYVGDSRTKLLRSIEIPNDAKFGDQITLNFDKPHYVPILTNDFEEIEINIKDDVNETIRFTYGRTRVKLHFKHELH